SAGPDRRGGPRAPAAGRRAVHDHAVAPGVRLCRRTARTESVVRIDRPAVVRPRAVHCARRLHGGRADGSPRRAQPRARAARRGAGGGAGLRPPRPAVRPLRDALPPRAPAGLRHALLLAPLLVPRSPRRRCRLPAFAAAAVFGAIGGVLAVVPTGLADPLLAYWTHSGNLVFMLLLGGFDHFLGPVLGALVFILLQDSVMSLTSYWRFVFGAILAVIVIFFPRGLMGLLDARRAAASCP